MRTELVADALKNAAATTMIETDAIWRSDRGSAGKSKRDTIRCLKRYVAREKSTIIKPIAGQPKPPILANLTP